MKVEVLYFDGCPNHTATVAAVREALKAERRSVEVQEVEVRTPEEAESRGFLGSPTVRINGLDVEPEARTLKSYGFGCRTYVEGSARSGAPSASLIRRAVSELGQHEANGRNLHECCAPAAKELSRPGSNISNARSGRTVLFAGGVAALLASTCCLGPLVLVTLGISGAWIGNLTRLEPYRPFFVGTAAVALFFAGRSLYRPAQACQPGEVCALPQTRRVYRFLFWASVALTLLVLVYPYFVRLFY
jgi:mercuric ion transport protein